MKLIEKQVTAGNVSLVYGLDDIDRGILKGLADDKSVKEISYNLNITIPKLNARLRIMKERYDCNTLAGLVTKLLNSVTG